MEKEEKYKLVFRSAKEFLNEIIQSHSGLSNSILKEILQQKSKFDNISDANKRLIESLQNRGMMPRVIGLFDRNKKEIEKILFGFNPQKILSVYKDENALLEVFKENLNLKNTDGKRNLWLQFARGVISGSRFMSSFKDKHDFDRFIKNFSLNKFTKASLPMLLSREVKGFGFALSCDFIKELGYREYPKPDVHLIEIFYGLGLSEFKDEYSVYKDIVEMAEVVGEDAYTVDKMFWLIGSGRFVGNQSIGRNRDIFIKKVKKLLV